MKENYKKQVILLMAITGVIRIIIAQFTGLGIGESYYFGGVMHPALSYFDQPPLFFWLATASVKTFGLSALALRLPSILMFAASTWLIYLIGKKLFSEKAGFNASCILNLSLVFTIPTATWLQPDASLMFFWLACIYYLLKTLFDEQKGSSLNIFNWIMIGVTLGLATLSKYHSIFIVIGAFLFQVLNKEQRRWLLHPGPYLALLICAMFSLPVIIWNNDNNWVSFTFQGSRAGTEAFRFHFDWFFRSIIGQALWIGPWIWWPTVKQIGFRFKHHQIQSSHTLLLWIAFLPIIFFTCITLWTNTDFHFHWQAPGYMLLFIFLGDYIAKREVTKRVWKRWWNFSIYVLIGFSAFALIYTETGFLKRYGPQFMKEGLSNLYDPTIEGYDFDDIATRFKSEGWTSNDSLFVVCDKWWMAGKIDWPLRGQKPLLVLNHEPRNYGYFDDPNQLLGLNAILLTKNGNEFIDNAQHYFDSVEQLPNIDIYRGGIKELSLKVYLGRKFKEPEIPMFEMSVYRQLEKMKAY